MGGMKITLDAAMRARDVSRPRSDHEAESRAGEPAAGDARDPATAVAPAGPAAADTGPAARRPPSEQPGEAPKAQRAHRRRRHR